MLNNYCITVGFMLKEPSLEEDENSKEKVCIFTLVTQDQGKSKEVPCMATGKICDTLMVYGQKGTFWSVGGIFYEICIKTKKPAKKQTTLKCLEIELLNKPEVPGIGIAEFVGKYSPKEIIKRARKNRNVAKD